MVGGGGGALATTLRTLAALLPSRALAAGLACLAAFWLLGRRSAEVAFFPDLGLPGATRPFRVITLARLVVLAAAPWRPVTR